MHVSLAGFVLFLHIAVAILAFMVAGVLHGALHSMLRARTVEQLRPFTALVHRLEPLLPFAALVLLGLGSWLVHLESPEVGWSDGWVITAVVTLVAVEAVAGAALAPRTKKLVAMVAAADDGPVPDDIRRAAADPAIWDIAHIATVGFLGIVFLMAAKPSGAVSPVIIVVAMAIGVALSRLQLSAAPAPEPVAGLPGQRRAGETSQPQSAEAAGSGS